MQKKNFITAEEITKWFIKEGWDENISFSELTAEEAYEKGYTFALNGMAKGRKFFRMNATGNIFDDNGNIAMFNVAISLNSNERKEST